MVERSGNSFRLIAFINKLTLQTNWIFRCNGFRLIAFINKLTRSDDFKKQKTLLSTGTTMVGLNNNGLNKIQIKAPNIKSDNLVLNLNSLIKVKGKLNCQLLKMVELLLK